MSENEAATLRQWCLERAFETRALNNVPHMEVTNVAEDYYQWITEGKSQSSELRNGYTPDTLYDEELKAKI